MTYAGSFITFVLPPIVKLEKYSGGSERPLSYRCAKDFEQFYQLVGCRPNNRRSGEIGHEKRRATRSEGGAGKRYG